MKSQSNPFIISDEQIVDGINRKDKDVFNLLYKKYWSYLLQVSSLYIDDINTREELVQELFVHLYTTPLYLQINRSLASYLMISLRNKILNHLRKQAIYQKHLVLAWHDTGDRYIDFKEQLETIDLQKRINSCVEQLPDKYKEVYILRKHQEFTLKRISETLKRPVDTVDKQLRKAIFLLRERLQGSIGYL